MGIILFYTFQSIITYLILSYTYYTHKIVYNGYNIKIILIIPRIMGVISKLYDTECKTGLYTLYYIILYYAPPNRIMGITPNYIIV